MRDNPPYPLFFLFCKSGGCNVRQTLFSLGRPAWPRGLVMREGDVFRLQKVWGAEIQKLEEQFRPTPGGLISRGWL
jgi:hypothetical protein